MYVNHFLPKNLSFATNDTIRLTISGSGEIGIGGSITKLSGSLFAGTVPKMEIITGNVTTTYSESIVLRHVGISSAAETRSLGLLMKLSTESMPNESVKMGGMMLRSTQTFANSPALHFVLGDAERMTIASGGNVGIGTTSPSAQLHVVQDAAATSFRIDDEVSDTTPFIVDQAGFVGINKSTPTANLDVTGSVLVTGSLRVTGSIVSTGSVTINGSDITTAWTSYTPTWTAASVNPAIGNGTIQGWYKLVGKTCFVRGNIVMGSTTTFGSGEWYVSMPFTASHADAILMSANLLDNGSAWYNALLNGARAGFNYKTAIQYQSTGGTAEDVRSTQPFTWTNTDRFIWNGSYEIA
jgi:hypothetical protein